MMERLLADRIVATAARIRERAVTAGLFTRDVADDVEELMRIAALLVTTATAPAPDPRPRRARRPRPPKPPDPGRGGVEMMNAQ